ncbi:MAG TPA: acyltransferase [Chitinophagaceae bacterium]|nr:acyltransferase [Chitinophagaceae bacterium]
MNQSSYLPNLNSVRAIAAMMVVLTHIEFCKPASTPYPFLESLGGMAVCIFFVLSGFIITYLLLNEKKKKNHISIRRFYLKRMLRIWPLFFLILTVGYFIIPLILPDYYQREHGRFAWNSILLNIFFLTNITFVLKLTPTIITVIWSIGIEEQFYIFWPWLARINNKTFFKAILLVILIFPLLKISFFIASTITHSSITVFMSSVLGTTRFELMAIGGFFGYLAVHEILPVKFFVTRSFFYKPAVQWISLAGFLGCVTAGIISTSPEAYQVITLPMGVFTGIVLLNLAINTSAVFTLENKFANYLGKISYGIYLWHMPLVVVFYHFMGARLQSINAVAQNIISYFSIIAITIAIASASYYFFELRFLNIRDKLNK